MGQSNTKTLDTFPTISYVIENSKIDRALLDSGESINLLIYSMYEQSGLRELKPITTIIFLANRSTKILRGIVEDVLVQVDKFSI